MMKWRLDMIGLLFSASAQERSGCFFCENPSASGDALGRETIGQSASSYHMVEGTVTPEAISHVVSVGLVTFLTF